jgi:DNA-directed RNA polymerase beta' subunit
MDKGIKALIEKAKQSGEIVTTGHLELPGRDRLVNATANRVPIEIKNIEPKGNLRTGLTKPTTQPLYLEKLVKAQVSGTASTIRSMRRVQPTETAIYCMTTDEMKKRSVMTITNMSTVHEIKNQGLFDKALGCIQKGKSCITCYRKYGECEGHEGYIPFVRKHINPYFVKEVIYILRCRCRICGHVYATKGFIEHAKLKRFSGLAYLKALAELSDSLHSLHDHKDEVPLYEHYLNEMKDHKIVYRLSTAKDAKEYSMDPENIEYTFKHFNKNDLEILGFTAKTHPSAFIMSGLLAISPHLRLPVHLNGKSENHPITARYLQIMKYSEQIRPLKAESDEDTVSGLLANQYAKIREIFFGPENKSTIRSGEQDFGLITNLTGKRGLLRFHAMGKRTNSSGRTVANPSVDGNNGEIGIPRSATETITVKEKVHQYNRRRLADAIRNGRIRTIVTVRDGTEIKLELSPERRSQFRLEIGMTVERPIADGDIVICGRQPSLHAASLLGFRVYLHDDEVTRVSIENLAGFNLDFDGDEVTFYVIQTVPARVEAIRNASSMYHLMNEQANRPMMGVAFHGLLGSYLGTETWNYVTYDEFDDDEFSEITENVLGRGSLDEIREAVLTVSNEHVDRIRSYLEDEIKRAPQENRNRIRDEATEYIQSYEETTNKLLNMESVIELTVEYRRVRDQERKRIQDYFMRIPRNVMIPPERFQAAISLVNDSHRKTTLRERCERQKVPYNSGRALLSLAFPRMDYRTKKDELVIKDGIIVKGVLKKSNIGTGDKSIIQQIVKLYSIEEADRFLNDVLKLADWFVMWHGFSIGQQTFVTDRKTIGGKIVNEVNLIQNRFFNIGPMPRDTSELFFWKRAVHGMMDRGLNFGKDVGNSVLKKSNGLNVLGTDGCGAKGSYMNTSQITGLLGCQKLQGDIQPAELNGATRRLVMFLENDCSLESIGYIVESFYTGLRPSGLFFHMASSREGLVDTANNTAVIGYTHRRLEKVLEDIIFDSRGMFTSLMGKIYVFTYCCIAVASQVFIETPETGKVLSYCDFKSVADMVNGVYERMALTR